MRVKNWRKFQHYKHRDPPWVKLHRGLLNDREWFSLSGDASKMLANCWLLASERDGDLPSVDDIAFRLRMPTETVASLISQLNHWIERDASAMLAGRTQVATTETETETETDAAPSAHSDEANLFRRGREVCGPSSGGLIAKLLKSKKGSVPLARAAIEQAVTKSDAREYIGRVIAGPVRAGPALMENGQPYPDGII